MNKMVNGKCDGDVYSSPRLKFNGYRIDLIALFIREFHTLIQTLN
jgi:hypothetical protein